jgi:FKBP-type peptidyl-prolyl cis-trans isomerase FkpA
VTNVRTRRALGAGTVALLVAFSGCVVDSVSGNAGGNVEDLAFAPILGIDLADFQQTSSGLLIKDEVVGEGAPVAPGDNVVLAFSGWLPNGTLFDSSTRTSENFPRIGSGGLIPGFDEGVTNMRLGGIRWIIIPPELGYGNSPPPNTPIPTNSFLVFKIEVLEIS